MFRSFVAAFYLHARRRFYRPGRLCGERAILACPPPVSSKFKQIIDRVSQILFAAKIPFCRLN
jgi:hypothetical protein